MSPRFLSGIDRVRLDTMMQAAREHERLATDQSRRIDIFDVIEREHIWLMFEPLKGLYGLYARSGDAAGIVINAHHPLSLQRLTAAHEYGHHVLGHARSLDTEQQIQWTGQPASLEEVAAQTFAAYFLMPLQLVNTALRRLGLPTEPRRLTPREAYLLSLEVGASYTAVVTHLASLRKISWDVANALRKSQPRQIKAEIGRGTRPEDAWADAWLLEPRDAGRLLYPRVNDELQLSLPEAPSTGFVWAVTDTPVVRPTATEDARDGVFLLLDDSFESLSPATRLGAGGVRHLVFRVLRPGRHRLRLARSRPWQPAEPAEVFEVNVEASPRRTGEFERGLSERQKPLLRVA